MKQRVIHLCLATLFLLMASSAWEKEAHHPKAADDFPSDVASIWFDLLYDMVKTEAISPPVASRIYGVAAVALYEAIVHGSREHQCSRASLCRAVPIQRAASRLRPLCGPGAGSGRCRVGVGVHRRVRRPQQLCLYSTGRAGTLGADASQLRAESAAAVLGATAPLGLTSGDACAPPPAYSTDPASGFYALALEVYQTNLTLTDEQHTIATYWADGAGMTGTPPGHWIAIMGQIARNEGLSLMAAAEGYARVGLAVADAFIGCWRTKYTYNLLRPVTYIQDVIDAAWSPLLSTPPFPEYPSGHSTQSGAVATVLTALFGVQAFTDTMHTDHGLVPPQRPRTFTSFDEAAEEAALSRLYGGIHYSSGNNKGLAQGRCIGQVTLDRIAFTREKEVHRAAVRLPHVR